MRRILIGCLLLAAATVYAAAGNWAPNGGFPSNSTTTAWATTTRCMDFVAMTPRAYTSIAVGSSSGPTTCDFGIYVSGGGSQVAVAGGVGCTGNPVTKTSLSFSLVAGTEYRLCWCGSAATGTYVSNDTNGGGPNSTLNAFATHIGTGANACTAGVLPSASGSLTPDVTFKPIQLYLE